MALTVEAKRQYSLDEVAHAWCALERQAGKLPIFISWFWMQHWLSLCPHKPLWVVCKDQDNLVASIFIMESPAHFPQEAFNTGWFNKTGQQTLDQIWIEYNDLLAIPNYREEAVAALLDWCSKQKQTQWRLEITDKPAAWLKHPDYYTDVMEIPAYKVVLSKEYQDYEKFLSDCSSNSRSRIRRAIKYVSQHYGELEIKKFDGMPPAEILNQLRRFHKLKWQDTAEGSGFDNPSFVAFHEKLMSTTDSEFKVQTLGFYAGSHCLGYTYNLLGHEQVYFYLSGINYAEQSNRYQPGLIMHTLAIAYFAQNGFKEYDFMGGDGQYKRSLANQTYYLFGITLLRKNWLSRSVLMLKSFKLALKKAIGEPLKA